MASFSDGRSFLWVGPNARLVNHATEEVDGCLGKFAFLRVERYSREHRSQPGIVLCPVAPEHQDIVHLAHYTAEACQDSGHALLKVFRCTGDPEWLFVEIIPPRWCAMNVINRREAGERGICQKPLFASNLVNSLAPVNWARVSSTLGRGVDFS